MALKCFLLEQQRHNLAPLVLVSGDFLYKKLLFLNNANWREKIYTSGPPFATDLMQIISVYLIWTTNSFVLILKLKNYKALHFTGEFQRENTLITSPSGS